MGWTNWWGEQIDEVDINNNLLSFVCRETAVIFLLFKRQVLGKKKKNGTQDDSF